LPKDASYLESLQGLGTDSGLATVVERWLIRTSCCLAADGSSVQAGLACFELALEDEGGEGGFLGRQTELCAKEDLRRPEHQIVNGYRLLGKTLSYCCGITSTL